MDQVLIEILEEIDDKIIQCRVLGIYTCEEEASEKYTQLKQIITNKIIMVPNISLQDISSIRISDYYCNSKEP